mgnify:FL=1
MIEKVLQFVADTIDGELQVCDDGFVICIKTGREEIDFIYNEAGEYEKTKVIKP